MDSVRNNAPECPGVAIGMPIMVTFEGLRTVKSELIGLARGQCLIVKLPLMPDVPLKFYQKNYFVIRYFHKGVAYGFRTTLIGVIKKPVRLFIFGYPEVIENFNLRKQERYECLIAAHIIMPVPDAEPLECDGMILDISPNGCRFGSTTSSDTKTANIAIGSVVDLSFRFSADNPRYTLPAEVRAINIDDKKLILALHYGTDPNIEAHQDAINAIQVAIVYL